MFKRDTSETYGIMVKYFENKTKKCLFSENLNFYFNKQTGFTATWGKTKEEDALYSPFGPMILDIEVSTICHGGKTVLCHWCYKSNTEIGNNMSYDTFVKIFNKLPKTVCQVAFGVGDLNGNPELFNIMEHCRKNGVIPNITINGERMTPRYYDLLSSLCGSVAVSRYNESVCYNAVQELTKRGMKQVNIHMLACQEEYDNCIQVISDMKHDTRLKDMHAVVFLALKPKGERNTYHKLSKQQFKNIVDYAILSHINFGFDSCSSHNFLNVVKGNKNIEQLKMMVEPCESFGLFSGYIDVSGMFFPCSFSPGIGEWKEGIDVLNCNDFIKDVWNHPKLEKYRQLSLVNNRKCLLFNMELK